MIGFLVTMENINRNEHITPVFKIIISNPNKTPTEALTPPAEKKIGKIDTYYATAQAVVNIKVAIILYYF